MDHRHAHYNTTQRFHAELSLRVCNKINDELMKVRNNQHMHSQHSFSMHNTMSRDISMHQCIYSFCPGLVSSKSNINQSFNPYNWRSCVVVELFLLDLNGKTYIICFTHVLCVMVVPPHLTKFSKWHFPFINTK